ncbi:DUF6777 domain-containing protein [Actinomycetospora sp.]|uniref:DUF6777 domain-containing protein n=1 Tax=Actinomycetospora sp. TaxID=1872135 RepID=UPI002F3F024A
MTAFDPRTVHTMPGQQFGTPRNDAAQYGSGQFRTDQFRTQGFAGQQFPGSVPPPPSRPSRAKRPLAAKIVAGMVAAGLVVAGAGTWMALSGSSAEAAVQTTSFAGANPTTVPFGTDAPQVAAVAATGPQTGDTTGLYAATTPAACTTADYLTQLQGDPAKLAALGGVFGIGATDVPAFVESLSPVVLRANTSVTDHPYTDGAFTAQPAILASGTAVLVNSYGEPTIKCFNGNPLTTGATAADAVTVVPTTAVITQFSFTSIDNSRVVVTPGKPDPKPNPGPNPTTPGTPGQPTPPTPDPVLQAKADQAKALAGQARAEATAARQKADDADTAARITATGAQSDEAAFRQALAQAKALGIPLQAAAKALGAAQNANPPATAAVIKQLTDDLAAKQAAQLAAAKISLELQKVANASAEQAREKADQAKYAGAAATSAEGVAAQADKNATDAQQKADDSAKTPTDDTTKNQPVKTKVDPTGTGPEGQAPITGHTPANTSIPCGAVADTTATTKNCTVPAGSADTATGTTPAKNTTGTQTGTTAGTTGTGSKGTSGSSTSGSSSSSSSAGGSQTTSKESTDK